MIAISSRRFWNACLGNLFEHYDTALFGFLSPLLAPLIFPQHEAITALILTYALIPLGMLARPFGALFFGYIGDIYGREQALFLTLAGMALVSGCIAFTPTHIQAGILAPILFCLGRILQNFLAAGETMGGAIFLLENTPKKFHDLLSSLYGASAIGGHLIASLGVYLISAGSMQDSGWRILYLCGCITALFGCFIRKPTVRSPQTTSRFIPSIKTLINTLKSHHRPLIAIIFSSGFSYATYAIALVLMNGFIPLISPLTQTQVLKINNYLLVLDLLALPLFGWIASKCSRDTFMLVLSLSALVLSIPLFYALESASLSGIVLIRVAFVIFGVAFFAPFHAWAQQLVPSNCRYAVISFGYALGSQLLGGPTAAISLWCFKKTGIVASIGWYWMLLALASSISIAITLYSKHKTESLDNLTTT